MGVVTLVHYLCHLPGEAQGSLLYSSKSYVLSTALSCGIHLLEWFLIQITRAGRGTHHCLRPKRETEKSYRCFFNALFCFYGHTFEYLTEFSRSRACLAQTLPRSFLEVFDWTVFMMQDRILGRFSSLPIFPSLWPHLWNFIYFIVLTINPIWLTPQHIFSSFLSSLLN